MHRIFYLFCKFPKHKNGSICNPGDDGILGKDILETFAGYYNSITCTHEFL